MKTIAAAAALMLAAPAFAATTFDFEAVTSFASIADFYNGGTDSAGKAGPALGTSLGTSYGVSFGGDALALANDFDTYFSNAPSPLGVMTPVGGDAALNAVQGFVGSISFYYASASAVSNAVQVWSGLNGSGALLASFDLTANAQAGGCSSSPFCHFDTLSGAFAGTGRSVTFGNAANAAAFDNVTVALVPEPSSVALMAIGLVGLGLAVRRGRR